MLQVYSIDLYRSVQQIVEKEPGSRSCEILRDPARLWCHDWAGAGLVLGCGWYQFTSLHQGLPKPCPGSMATAPVASQSSPKETERSSSCSISITKVAWNPGRLRSCEFATGTFMNLLFLVSAGEFGALICGIHIDSDTQWPHDMLSYAVCQTLPGDAATSTG